MYIPTRLASSPSPPQVSISTSTFLGADLTNSPGNVNITKSPDCINMIRDVPGKVRKRMGFYNVTQLGSTKINGRFETGNGNEYIHSGNRLYKITKSIDENGKFKITNTIIYSAMADVRSQAWEFANKLYIADGLKLLCVDGASVKPASESAKTPIFKIACDPKGIGDELESINLLSAKYEQRYAGTATDLTYQLSLIPLDSSQPVSVQILQADGSWGAELIGKTDFTVNHFTGVVTFVKAPGVSPITGEDNIRITAGRSATRAKEDMQKINKCKIGIQYGVNGTTDRLFLSGNPDYPNYDWFSDFNDPTYFADLSYGVLGQSDSAILGYSIINARLAAFKNGMNTQDNVVVREGTLVDKKAAFRIVNVIQGEGAVAPFSFAHISNEPLFLTRLGVYAITAQDITGEKYSQCRSFFVNGALLNENLASAYAYVYKDMYFLSFENGHVYILDGLQPVKTDKSAPYSTRQYTSFYLNKIPARIMWESEGTLWFGRSDGMICCFYSDPENTFSYNDNGTAISAKWRLPDISGNRPYKNKTFTRFYASLKSAVATGLHFYAHVSGKWEAIFSDFATARYFSFTQLVFSKLSFSGDITPRTIGGKININKTDKAGFIITNNKLNEPFGINSISLEFKETGYK